MAAGASPGRRRSRVRSLGAWFLRIVRRDPWLVVLGALAVLQYAFLAPRLVYPDLGLDYPFLGGDSLDWLLNARALAGADVRNSVRPPLLPLVLALLRRFGCLSLFPLLNLAFHHAAAVGTHLALRRRFGGAAAFTCGLLVLLDASVLLLALQVMADLPAAILLGASCAAFLAAGRRPGLYVAAGALAGLSAVTQQAALLLPLPVAITLLATRRADLRRRALWTGVAVFAAFPAAWFVAKRVLAGTFLDAGVLQWSLLGVQPENVPHYLVAGLSFWGWPALVLLVLGAVASLRELTRSDGDAEDSAWALFPLVTTLTLLGFFGLFYDFLAKRFLVYALFPALPLVARGLSTLRGTRLLAPASLLAVAVAAWPLPNPELANRATLWPLPTVYSLIPTGHAFDHPVPHFEAARLEVARWPAPLRFNVWSRVLRESRHREPARPRDSGAWEGLEAAIYLTGPAAREPSRYQTLTRLGYLVGRRVAYVPENLYPEDWWAWRELEPLGLVDRYRLFRLRLPGVTDGAIVALAGRNPTGRGLGRQARWGREASPRPGPERLAAAAVLAREVAAFHESSEGPLGPVFVLPEARGEWERLLPFFLAGVLARPEGEEADRIAELAELGARRTVPLDGLRLIRTRSDRYSFTVVRARDD